MWLGNSKALFSLGLHCCYGRTPVPLITTELATIVSSGKHTPETQWVCSVWRRMKECCLKAFCGRLKANSIQRLLLAMWARSALMRGLSLSLSPVNRHVCLSPHRTSEKHTNTDVSLANARVHYIYDTNLSSTAVPQMHCENALTPLEGASAQQ